MKYLLICVLFFLIYWDVQAQSEVHIPKETILQRNPELTSNSLSPAQMQAYTKRAKQKLGDMIDYMKIIINAEHTSVRTEVCSAFIIIFI